MCIRDSTSTVVFNYTMAGLETGQTAFAEPNLLFPKPDCFISGDFLNSFFKRLRSSCESRLYLDVYKRQGKVLTPEQAEVEKKPEPKHSLTEKMNFLQEQDKKQPEQKSPQHKQKKQNMEL